MKAITTRYIGATERRPARILASDQDGNRVTVPTDGDSPFPYTDWHHAAAVALCHKMQWPGAETLVDGTIRGGMAWVFVPRPAAGASEAAS